VEQTEKRGRGRPRGTFIVAPDQDKWLADLAAAAKLANEANEQLRDLIDQAHAHGVTYRAIGPVVGVAVQTLSARAYWAKKRPRKGQAQNNE